MEARDDSMTIKFKNNTWTTNSNQFDGSSSICTMTSKSDGKDDTRDMH